MKIVGFAFCPQDSPDIVKQYCGTENVIPANGGENVIAKMVDILLDKKQIPDCSMEDIENLDKKERF